MRRHAIRSFAAVGPALRERTVGELVVERPSRARVLEAFGLDYCSGGSQPPPLAWAAPRSHTQGALS